MQQVPHHIIRFYSNTDYALECIANKEITFIHVNKLNDPFDPNFVFFTEFNDDYITLIKTIRKSHPLHAEKFKRLVPEINFQGFLKDISQFFQQARESLFVFSVCEVKENEHPRDNLYMWGHYANGHRGIAIEFDARLLEKFLQESHKHSTGQEITECLFKIEYVNDVPIVTSEEFFEHAMKQASDKRTLEPYTTALSHKIDITARSKSQIWRQENEWRFIWKNDETQLKIHRVKILTKDFITAVYLGSRINQSIAKDIILETKRNFPNAKIFQAEKDSKRFALAFKKLD